MEDFDSINLVNQLITKKNKKKRKKIKRKR